MHGVFYDPKPLVGGFGCDKLVLYGIRLLAKKLLGTVLDTEVDQSPWDVGLERYKCKVNLPPRVPDRTRTNGGGLLMCRFINPPQ